MANKLFKNYISNDNSVLLGNLIRINRVEQNISSIALSYYSDVSRCYLNQLERGIRVGSLKLQQELFWITKGKKKR